MDGGKEAKTDGSMLPLVTGCKNQRVRNIMNPTEEMYSPSIG